MKFFCSLYELQQKKLRAKDKALPPRKGAILRIEWSEDRVGYSDLHPWPELGDPDLESHLTELRQLRLTPMVEQAIWLASLDAVGRKEQRNIYDNQTLLKNNALLLKVNPHTVELLDPLAQAGYSSVKIKVGESLADEIEFINRAVRTHQMRLRLDFNCRLTLPSFQKFVDGLSPAAKRQIEYVEDPFPYTEESWAQAQKLLPLAIDWELNRVPIDQENPVVADVLIVKPTHQDVNARVAQALRWGKKITVTSHMGHPLGVMQCAHVAQLLHKKYPNSLLEPGCMTFDVFEPTEFHSLLNLQGPYIKKVGGWGIGFDFVLKSQKWNLLRVR
ncbi:MAG: enolase C-terminal domain-like protein [Bdellovibrionales bacterium]